jgi:hypothetical protein
MTKIIFDVKRDNGYGEEVYLKGSLSWFPMQNSTTSPKANISIELGSGPVELNVEPTDGTFLWTVTELVGTSGGTPLSYQRTVEVPDSETPINYLDLPDGDEQSIFPELN